MNTSFHDRTIKILKRIPKGRVATYGQIATLAGNPRGARQVVRTLNSSSERYDLPWFRVINRLGEIAIPKGDGYELQKALLENEKINLNSQGRVNLAKYQWRPRK